MPLPRLPAIVDQLGAAAEAQQAAAEDSGGAARAAEANPGQMEIEVTPAASSGLARMRARIRNRWELQEAESQRARESAAVSFGSAAIDVGKARKPIRLARPEFKFYGAKSENSSGLDSSRLDQTRRFQSLVFRNKEQYRSGSIPTAYIAASELRQYLPKTGPVDIKALIRSIGGEVRTSNQLPLRTMASIIGDPRSINPDYDPKPGEPLFIIEVDAELGPAEQRAAAAMALGRYQMGMPLGPYALPVTHKELHSGALHHAVRDMLAFAGVLTISVSDSSGDKDCFELADELCVPSWLVNYRRYGSLVPSEHQVEELAKFKAKYMPAARKPAVAGSFEQTMDENDLAFARAVRVEEKDGSANYIGDPRRRRAREWYEQSDSRAGFKPLVDAETEDVALAKEAARSYAVPSRWPDRKRPAAPEPTFNSEARVASANEAGAGDQGEAMAGEPVVDPIEEFDPSPLATQKIGARDDEPVDLESVTRVTDHLPRLISPGQAPQSRSSFDMAP